ncbi:hypothetical protein L3Q82_019773 [Scortum barcoo]|uniref:Uncharacterized protein n=1 Tax=Scortum barcoo TaxID=214431 RepID=A0ACB8VCH7_9TELE|nr:hypothetical protein L3Q82_019773 [Scortum barcoo]
MQQLFIDLNDQWERVLWEPSHPGARGTQQTSEPEPSSPSAVTPGRPQEEREPRSRNTDKGAALFQTPMINEDITGYHS